MLPSPAWHNSSRSEAISESIVESGDPVPLKLDNLLLKVVHLANPIVCAPTHHP